MVNKKNICLICGSDDTSIKYKSHNNKRESNSFFFRCSSVISNNIKPTVQFCHKCKASHIPKLEIPKLKELYTDVVDTDYIANLDVKKKTFSYAFNKLKKYIPQIKNKKFFEIGVYCGIFQDILKEKNIKTSGIEPSKWAYNFSSKKHKNIKNIFFDKNYVSKDKFDVVCSWDVLEHVEDPVSFIKKMFHLTNQNGYIALSTIDITSSFARIMGYKWQWIMPMHIHYFGNNSLESIFEDLGMKKIYTGPYRHYAKISYILNHFLPNLSSHKMVNRFISFFDSFVIPVSLGDIKMYIYKKVDR